MLDVDNLPYLGELIKGYILDLAYPIHSIYMTYDDTNPNLLFGGKWIRLNDCFIYAANGRELNRYDGNKKINIETLPQHNHTFTGDPITGSVNWRVNTENGVFYRFIWNGKDSFSTSTNGVAVDDAYTVFRNPTDAILVELNATPTGTTESTGGGIDYVPYHLNVIMWKRIE